ncbi:hypothetical protein ARMSODRAFT_978322 [Armillaria solidipes]|uniref:Uncharacterized protein n=1 Tax=Armillaria solidipes TaxID=1076256 RepID=A0A2H3B9H8_9AGAR|nr:hypothetical protein ARMSODRAFT_978322 [Armillaria solidipes]
MALASLKTPGPASKVPANPTSANAIIGSTKSASRKWAGVFSSLRSCARGIQTATFCYWRARSSLVAVAISLYRGYYLNILSDCVRSQFRSWILDVRIDLEQNGISTIGTTPAPGPHIYAYSRTLNIVSNQRCRLSGKMIRLMQTTAASEMNSPSTKWEMFTMEIVQRYVGKIAVVNSEQEVLQSQSLVGQ